MALFNAYKLLGFSAKFSRHFRGFFLLAQWKRSAIALCIFCLPISGCLGKINDKPAQVTINYTPPEIQPIAVSAEGFVPGQSFPQQSLGFRAGGNNISPAISWAPVLEAQSYTIVISDAAETPMIYWILVNIPGNIFAVTLGASPRHIPTGSIEMPNSMSSLGRYSGPLPANMNKRVQKNSEKLRNRGNFITPTSDKNTEKDFDEKGRNTIQINIYASNMKKIPTLTVDSMFSALQNTLIARGKISADIKTGPEQTATPHSSK